MCHVPKTLISWKVINATQAKIVFLCLKEISKFWNLLENFKGSLEIFKKINK